MLPVSPSSPRVRRSPRPPAVALGAVALLAGAAFAYAATGPSSSESPYLVPVLPGVSFTSILSVGDSVNNKPDGTPYRMVGIPDGLGAFENECDGTFTVLMNHELGNTAGVTRAHGAKGSFVSKWVIDKDTLEVLHGEDLIERVARWTAGGWDTSLPVAISRMCSADLPEASAFWNKKSRRGYNGRLFMNGEETGAEGLAYAHTMDGTSYQLPWLGRYSWENCVAHPSTGDRTVVVGTDDSGDGQLYVYVGTKNTTGATPVDRAGLTNGVLFGVKVAGYPFELPVTGIPSGTAFTTYALGDVSAKTGATLQTESRAAGVTEFQRPEDACWDPRNPDDLYFVTTASFTGSSRLWRLSFVDAARPELGGVIDMLLDGSEGQKMLDNLTMNRKGELYLQEDPGGQEHLAKVWRYDVRDAELTLVAQHDPVRFTTGALDYRTIDEESSGIIDVSDILGKGTYLLDVQAHYGLPDAELVQGGQLLVMRVEKPRKAKDRKDCDDDRDDDRGGRGDRDRCDD